MITINTSELTFAIVDSFFTFVGLVLVIFGWIIPYIQEKKQKLNLEKIKWEKEQIDKQISSLYGPIYAIIRENNVLFSLILYQLGRKYVIPKDKSFSDLPEQEQEIWKHYMNEYKIPNQNKIVSILRNNIHLIYNSEIPTCYNQFLDYACGLDLLNNQKNHSVQNYYEYHYCYNYPIEFDNYIKNTLNILLTKQAELIGLSDKNSKKNKRIYKKNNLKQSIKTVNSFEDNYVIRKEDLENSQAPKLTSIKYSKTIYLNKNIYYIGRNKELSDLYINNNLINSNHAYIIKKEYACYLIDNNSINGTFVNEKKLDLKDEHKLNNGDIITFANEKFLFNY